VGFENSKELLLLSPSNLVDQTRCKETQESLTTETICQKRSSHSRRLFYRMPLVSGTPRAYVILCPSLVGDTIRYVHSRALLDRIPSAPCRSFSNVTLKHANLSMHTYDTKNNKDQVDCIRTAKAGGIGSPAPVPLQGLCLWNLNESKFSPRQETD
jgi:hypothetical protein